MHPFEEEAAAIRELLAEIGEVKAEIEGLRGEREALLGTCGTAYWEENYTTVMETLSADGRAPLSAELREETEAVLTRQRELTAELCEKASLQAELLGAYEKGYNRYLGEEEE